jgi:hypothetical protein
LCRPVWIDRVKEGCVDDDKATQLLDELNEAGGVLGAFTLKDGLIRHHGRIWLGSNRLAHQYVLHIVHNSGIGGHSGFTATYYRIKKLFSWAGMKQDIKQFIEAC